MADFMTLWLLAYVATGAFVDVPEGGGAVAHRGVNSPVDFSGTPVGPRGGVPGLGEHTEEVLDEVRSGQPTR